MLLICTDLKFKVCTVHNIYMLYMILLLIITFIYQCSILLYAEGGFDVDEVTFIISVVVSALGSSLITGLVFTVMSLCARRQRRKKISSEAPVSATRAQERVYEELDCVMTYNNDVYQFPTS